MRGACVRDAAGGASEGSVLPPWLPPTSANRSRPCIAKFITAEQGSLPQKTSAIIRDLKRNPFNLQFRDFSILFLACIIVASASLLPEPLLHAVYGCFATRQLWPQPDQSTIIRVRQGSSSSAIVRTLLPSTFTFIRHGSVSRTPKVDSFSKSQSPKGRQSPGHRGWLRPVERPTPLGRSCSGASAISSCPTLCWMS